MKAKEGNINGRFETLGGCDGKEAFLALQLSCSDLRSNIVLACMQQFLTVLFLSLARQSPTTPVFIAVKAGQTYHLSIVPRKEDMYFIICLEAKLAHDWRYVTLDIQRKFTSVPIATHVQKNTKFDYSYRVDNINKYHLPKKTRYRFVVKYGYGEEHLNHRVVSSPFLY